MLKFIIDLLSQASVLLALFTMLGLIFLKKTLGEILSATLRSMIGFLILGAGGGILTAALAPFGLMISQAFHIQGIIPSNEASLAFTVSKYGSSAALILICSLGVHLLIARFTPIKFIFLSGHLIFYMSTILAVVLGEAGVIGLPLILSASFITGASLSLSPLLTYWAMPKVTGEARPYAMAQFSNITYGLSGLIGSWVGKGSPSTEDLKLPQNLSVLRDTNVAISITMVILYMICALASGKSYVENRLSGGQHYLVFAFISAMTFAAGVVVLFYGIKMIIDEIIPAFKGISDKMVPGAIPALDCPVIFPFAPNAVILGFLFSLLGGFSGLILQNFLKTPLIIPGIVPYFFTGATAGIFGNATGGRRGCMIGAYVHGFIIAFLPLLLLPYMGEFRHTGTIFSDADHILIGSTLGRVLKFLGF